MKDKLLEFVKKSTDVVEKENYQYYWEANGYKFNSSYLARWYEKEYNCWAEFKAQQFYRIKEILNDKIVDQKKNYNLEYIKKLRSQYKDIKLLFSGGYDSTTIFYEFVENNIHLDETVTMLPLDIEHEIGDEIICNTKPLLEQYKDSIGKATFVQNNYEDIRKYWSDSLVFFSTSYADRMPPPMASVPLTHWRPEYQEDVCYVKGIDKPQLIYYNNKWYVVAIDSSLGTHFGLSNMIFFWLDPENIKSYIQDARKYRDYLCENQKVSGPLQFFKFYDQDHLNHIVGRRNILDPTVKLGKEQKAFIRRTRLIEHEKFDIIGKFCDCIHTLQTAFPETSIGFRDWPDGKFAWMVDIDSLEVYTQNELIPNGFET